MYFHCDIPGFIAYIIAIAVAAPATKPHAINSELSNFDNLIQLNNNNPEIVQKIKVWFENYKGKNIVNFVDYGNVKEANDLIFLTERYYKRFGVRPRS